MAIYVRLVDAKQEHIEQVYSPDDATAFTSGDAQIFRVKAHEHWPNFNWEIEKAPGEKYRVRAST